MSVDPVASDQQEWRRARRRLNRSRAPLARTAARLYRHDVRLGGLPFLAPPSWMPANPVPLDGIRLEWCDEAAGAEVTGTEPEARGVLPARAPGRRYSRYTDAMGDLDPPALFEDRPSYRLLDFGTYLARSGCAAGPRQGGHRFLRWTHMAERESARDQGEQQGRGGHPGEPFRTGPVAGQSRARTRSSPCPPRPGRIARRSGGGKGGACAIAERRRRRPCGHRGDVDHPRPRGPACPHQLGNQQSAPVHRS